MNERIRTIISKFVSTALSVLVVVMILFLVLVMHWLTKDYRVIDWKITHYEMQQEVYKV
jgi:di/tricarboxylate transporter